MTRLPTPAFVVCALAGYLIALYPGTLPRGAVSHHPVDDGASRDRRDRRNAVGTEVHS